MAGLVRAWALDPAAVAGLVPVDPRRCRSAGCAVAVDRRLTSANRRITVFSSVTDRRRTDGTIVVEYFAYRPGLGWSASRRIAAQADVDAFAKTPLLDAATPQVIALESARAVAIEITSARGGTP